MNPKGKPKDSGRYWIKLELLDPIKEEDTWRVSSIVTVETHGHKRVPNLMIRFRVDGQAFGDPLRTDGEGVVVADLLIDTPGKHLMQAEVFGSGFMDGKFVIIPKDKPTEPPKTAKIEVREYGDDGKFCLEIFCRTAEDKPVPNASIIVRNMNDAVGPFGLVHADENGRAEYYIETKERRVALNISDPKSGAQTIKRLYIYQED